MTETIVLHHLHHLGALTDYNDHFSRARYRRIQQIPRHKARRVLIQWYYHDRILAALTFMHRYRICMLYLLEVGERIDGYPAVKVDNDALLARSYLLDDADIAVKNALSLMYLTGNLGLFPSIS